MFGLSVIFFGINAVKAGGRNSLLSSLLFFLIWSSGLVIAVVLSTFYSLWRSKKFITFPLEASWEIRGDGLKFQSPTATIFHPWKTFQRVSVSPKTIMLFFQVNKSMALIMPLRGIPAGTALENLVTVISEKIRAAC
jgi:hypothetical protein